MLLPGQIPTYFSLLHENDIDTVFFEKIHNSLHLLLVVKIGLSVPLLQEVLEWLRVQLFDLYHIHLIFWTLLVDYAYHGLVGNPVELEALLNHLLVGLVLFHMIAIFLKRLSP